MTTTSPPLATNRTPSLIAQLTAPFGALIVVYLGMHALNLWVDFWWAAALVMFALIVIMAERIGQRLPLRYKRAYEMTLAILFPVLLLTGWEAIVTAEILNPRWFPPPSKIGSALIDITVNYDAFNESSLLGRPWLIPQVWSESGWEGVVTLVNESHVWATLMRVFLGFLIGAIPGIFIGMLMGMNKTIRSMLDTTMSAIYVLPKIAIFPIMMLVFDNPFGEGPKVSVVAISAFFLVAISTMTGVRDIDPVYLQAGKNYGAGRWQMFRHVIIPGALPVIFGGLRLALGTALIVIVAIEFLRAKIGVGWVVYYHWQVGIVDKMYAGLFVVMLMGIVLTYGLQWLEKRLMPWRK
jgi:ABC-type nitrate/sulfonate/bicarbonate transport system permease component